MKFFLSLLFVLNSYVAFSQLKPLQSITWASDNFGTLRFTNNKHIYWELDQSFKSYGRFMDLDFEYYQSKDTLILINPYPEVLRPGNIKRQVLYKFIMERKGNELLSLTPVNDDAKKVIPLPIYVLRNIAYVDDPSIKFRSIHLDMGGASEMTSVVGLTYSEFTVNIDNKGNYYAKKLSGGYKSPATYLKGKLNALQLDSINYLIQHSEIKKLQNWKEIVRMDHGGSCNFIIAYNDNVLRLKGNILPGITANLSSYITSLAKKLALEPDEQKHDFKQEGDLNYYQ